MALVTITVPKCDKCGELSLPRPGPARDNPRGMNPDKPGKTNYERCGKCKTPLWDADYDPAKEESDIARDLEEHSEVFAMPAAEVVKNILENPAAAGVLEIKPGEDINPLFGLPHYIGDEDHPLNTGTYMGIDRTQYPVDREKEPLLPKPLVAKHIRCKHMSLNCPICHGETR